MGAVVRKLDRLGNALIVSCFWLEYIWNRDTKEAPVAFLSIDTNLLTVSLYSTDQCEVEKFSDYIKKMMESVNIEIQNGYGGIE